MVVLYDYGEEIIEDVPYDDSLDYWNGNNWTNGGTGKHLGFGQTKKGKFYLVHGTQWVNQRNYAKVVTAERIVQEAIKSGNVDTLKDYPELQTLYDEVFKYDNESFKSFYIRIEANDTTSEVLTKIDMLKKSIQEYIKSRD